MPVKIQSDGSQDDVHVRHRLLLNKTSGLDGVHEHSRQALALFGKRPEPDYRNAIKEAISAIEGAVKLIEGVRGGGLQDALDALAKKADIRKALRDGLVRLYGFDSRATPAASATRSWKRRAWAKRMRAS